MNAIRQTTASAADSELKNIPEQQIEEDKGGITLPETLCTLLTEKNNRQVDIMLEQLAAGVQVGNPRMRLKAACYLTDALELLIAHQEWQRMDKLLPAAEIALAAAVENEVGAWQMITALSTFAAYQIEMGKYASARRALLTFAAPNALPASADKIHERVEQLISDLATRPLLELLLVEYLFDKERGNDAGRLFAVFGTSAAEFLLEPQNLKQCQDKADALLRLFGEIGQPAEKSLCMLLRQTADWYLIRNIIRLLGEKGSIICFAEITPFLDHEDLRVKGEVLRAASRIEAPSKKDFFLKALKTVPKQLTELVVSLLGDIPDSSLVAPLADLLDEAALIKNKAGLNLQAAVCQTLGKIGSVKAVPTLKKVIAANSGTAGGPAEQQLLRAAEQAIQIISHGGKHKRPGVPSPDVPTQNNPFAAREAGIIRTAMSGDRATAARQLFELIAECVQEGDLFNAERLRDRFSEINPNAIAEIIQSAELIQEAKSGVQVRGYLDIWSNLLHELTSEEFSAIYHELENRVLEPEEILVRQGERNDELFFVNHGTIRVFYKKNDRKIYIKSLSDGDLAGENFFSTSVWTVSMSAVTESRISILKRSCFERWKEAYPGLEEKLRNFYNSTNNIRDLLQRKGLNRRTFDRYTLSRKVDFQVIDTPGKPLGQKFKGRLFDVSRGGLSMVFRMAQQKHIRVLLGRNMQITIPVVGSPPELNVQGQVLSIQPADEEMGEYKISLVFGDALEQEELQTVLG
ncbi:MAG: cAMP-binding domain of CRP or a regulatory subunit of cAMP-dependent protein kinase [Candidatus Electronema aureum]|uniref:cAMP-binding domain of CRP or a regulatory subunit of cAMP-dependent protein kinase n=1 Tax=Candidatus Electronema aureum TaxID=2005002 RepID=A0A521FZI4_9BACT|nr:MAG: cAMP-binding domain of CRP or a regulatory subunit of cAMP-dependent protein kinase [Candidatus Electronema aureum]